METGVWLGLLSAGWSLFCYRLGLWDRGRLDRGQPLFGRKRSRESETQRRLSGMESYRGPGSEGRK